MGLDGALVGVFSNPEAAVEHVGLQNRNGRHWVEDRVKEGQGWKHWRDLVCPTRRTWSNGHRNLELVKQIVHDRASSNWWLAHE